MHRALLGRWHTPPLIHSLIHSFIHSFILFSSHRPLVSPRTLTTSCRGHTRSSMTTRPKRQRMHWAAASPRRTL
jgi:hypothetical protein